MTSAEPAGRLFLVRHGATTWSENGRHTSTTDLPLTDAGEQAAVVLRDRLAAERFALVLTSPRLRARRTAELAGFADAAVDADLAEWDYGDYEGVTTAEIRQTVPGWTVWTHPVPHGESPAEVSTRLDRVKERVLAAGGDTLVFGHAHSLRALTARWLDLPVAEGRHFALATATLSVLGWDRESPAVQRWNS